MDKHPDYVSQALEELESQVTGVNQTKRDVTLPKLRLFREIMCETFRRCGNNATCQHIGGQL